MAIPKLNDKGRMADIPLSPEAKITVERRGEIVLIGVNRPQVYNRFDPDAFFGLAKAYYDFDNDPSLRAAVFFGHGENFSRGIDVDAFAGWGNAMRYMLTGDHWDAQEAYRMGVIQQIAPNPAKALETGTGLARPVGPTPAGDPICELGQVLGLDSYVVL